MKLATLAAGASWTAKTIETGIKDLELVFTVSSSTANASGQLSRVYFQTQLASMTFSHRFQNGMKGNTQLSTNWNLWDLLEFNANKDDSAIQIKTVGSNQILKSRVSISDDGAFFATKDNSLVFDISSVPANISVDIYSVESPIIAKSLVVYEQKTVLDQQTIVPTHGIQAIGVKSGTITELSIGYNNGIETRHVEVELQTISEQVNEVAINDNGIIVSGYYQLYCIGVDGSRVVKVTPSGNSAQFYLMREHALTFEHPSHAQHHLFVNQVKHLRH